MPVTTTTTIVSYAVTQERRGAVSSATLPELMDHVTAVATSSVKQVNHAIKSLLRLLAGQVIMVTSQRRIQHFPFPVR